MKTAIELIKDERERHVSREGYTTEHDDMHRNFELVRAAICYAEPIVVRVSTSAKNSRGQTVPFNWPFEYDSWNPKTYKEDLIRAGALIAAEIDRLQHAKE